MAPIKHETISPSLPLQPLEAPKQNSSKPRVQTIDQNYGTASRQRSTSSERVLRIITPKPAPLAPPTPPISRNNQKARNSTPLQHESMPVTATPPSIRPSSGAWNPTDDERLMTARSEGMHWASIQQAYFPDKTPNACRKRHERLMERRSVGDWDGKKLETLAKNYMSMRREIWQHLAERTGEKWNVVEQKV